MTEDAGRALLGTTIDGKYRIENLLGVGGMGAVYRAVHLGTGRPVALKTILPDLVRHPEALERFRREARAAGRLRHPNIVDVTDFGVAVASGTEIAYLVMEHLEGRTLRDLMHEAGALPAGRTVDIVEQIALALGEAHAAGVVHRDLKPDNIWLVPDSRGGYIVRVLDFGIAKLRELDPETPQDVDPPPQPVSDSDLVSEAETVVRSRSEPERGDETLARPSVGEEPTLQAPPSAESLSLDSPVSLDLTVQGTTLGTPAYMSPEQCAGAGVTARSDLYSLGIIAWEMLVGRRPFEGTFAELIEKHRSEMPPRVDEVDRRLPESLGRAIARAVEKDPEERYPSARAVSGSLRVAIEGTAATLRRAAVLYLNNFGSFIRISWAAALPGIALMVLLGAPALVIDPLVFIMLPAVGWSLVTVSSHALFASVVEQLRHRPLEAVDRAAVLKRVLRRLNLSEDKSIFRALPRILGFYVRCELPAPAGQGDLAFQIAFHEQISPAEAAGRCALLARTVKRSYDVLRLVILASIVVPPALLFALILAAGILVGVAPEDARLVAVLFAFASIPFIALVLNPILSPALAILYFRARQARGEDVVLPI